MNTLFASKVRAGVVAGAMALGVVAIAAPQAHAQEMTANVPFSFEGNGTHFSPGKYVVIADSPRMLELSNQTTGQRAILLTHSAEQLQPNAKGELIFRRVGDRYFLKQAWSVGSTTGTELPTSRAEKEAQIAQTETPRSNVIVALNRLPR